MQFINILMAGCFHSIVFIKYIKKCSENLATITPATFKIRNVGLHIGNRETH